MSNKNKNKNNKTAPSPAAKMELTPILEAPQRDGFDISRWRMAIQMAEDPKEPDRTLLYDIYNDVLLDSHLTAVLDKRTEHITGSRLVFQTDGAPNEAIEALMDTAQFADLLTDILNARFWGYSVAWCDLSNGMLHKYSLINRNHIIPTKGLFVEKRAAKEGKDFTKPPLSNYIVRSGKVDDLGLLLKAVSWVLLKRGDVSDWATFNEIFATPFRKATYQAYDDRLKKEVTNVLKNSGSAGYAVVPEGTTLELMQANAAGSSDAFLKLAEFCDKQLSKLFLHSTMTTDAEGGQYKGDAHERSEDGIHKSDRRYVQSALNSMLIPLLELHGFSPNGGRFVYPNEEHLCKKDRLDMDLKLANKIEIDAEYWYETYNIPVPKGGAKLKQTATVAPEKKANKPAQGESKQRKLSFVDPKPKSKFDKVCDFFGVPL